MSATIEVHQCVERYYQSLRTSSADGVRSVFHPNARVTGYLPDGLHEMTVDDFEILSCEVAGETASVRIREAYLGMVFVDTFGMLRVEGRWLIYSKLFHVED